MDDISHDRIMALFILARQQEAAGITGDQIKAVEQLKAFSVRGNADATGYLHRLKMLPDIHPFVREVLLT